MKSEYPNSEPEDLPEWVVKRFHNMEFKKYGSRMEFLDLRFEGKHYTYHSPPAPGPRSVRAWYRRRREVKHKY